MTRPEQHGKSWYRNHGCRCDVCRAAQREYMLAYHKRRREAGLPDGDPRHGTNNGYTNRGCRCEPCTKAGSAADAASRRRREANQRRLEYLQAVSS